MAKVQGEGDHESARRYNARTRRYVQSGAASKAKPAGPVDESALRQAKGRAKKGEQDGRDAQVFRRLTSEKH